MLEPYAEATCVLKVNNKCQACKMKTMEILGSVCGVYNVDINAEQGLVNLQAVVEPNLFLKAMAGTGPHAEPKWVKLQHPKMNRYNTYSNGYNHGSTFDPYNHRRALPGYLYGTTLDPYNQRRALPEYLYGTTLDPYNQRRTLPEYSHPTMEPTNYPHYHGSDPYYHGSGLPPASRRRGPFH